MFTVSFSKSSLHLESSLEKIWIGVPIVGIGVMLLLLGTPLNAETLFRPDRPDFFEQGRERFQQEIDRFQQPQIPPRLEIEYQSTQWSPVVLRAGGSVVWMPQGAITHETKTVSSETSAIDFDVISTTSNLGKFVVAFSDVVDEFATTEPSILLERVYKRITENQTGFEAVGDRSFIFKNYPAREFILKNKQETITYRVLVVSDRLFVMAVNQDPKAPNLTAIKFFFESFQLL